MRTNKWFRNSAAKMLACILLLTGAANSYAQVTVSGAVSGNGTYTTLGAAFTAIGTAQASANIIIDITANTTEAATGAVLGAGNWSSITIRPSGGAARTITGAVTAGSPLIDFNGADNVTINGLNTGGNSLTISNTTASATTGTSTIQFRADAVSNTITNCSILGSGTMATGTNGGNIFFSTGTTTGNDNNTISNCNIGPAGSNLPSKGIYMNGTTTTTASNNSGNTFTANNIFDYFGAAVSSAGIYITSGNTDNNITNNKFYQTAARTHTSSSQYSAIWISNTSGNNFQITGNTIGYASSAGTGTFTFTGVSASYFVPIFLSVGTTTASVASTNTITAIALSGAMSGTSTSAPFRGIYVSSGLATCNDNVIGSQTATGAITFTSTSGSASDVIGLFNFGSNAWTTNNNTIGGITASNASAAANIYGLRCNTSSSVSWTCNNNTIGGTVANSINSTSTAIGTIVNGILNSSPAGTFTGNTIRNMTVAGGTGTTTSISMAGIMMAATSANHTVSQNSIYALANTNTGSSAVSVVGIYFGSTTGTNLIDRNLIHSLSVVTSAASNVYGLFLSSGTVTMQNNMIRLGIDASGSSLSGPHSFYGLYFSSGTPTVYHNSVYIGGTGVSGSSSTYAYYNTVTTARNVRNNIFVNDRSNGAGTGKHYAVREGSTTGLTMNYNIYYASGTGGVLGNLTSDRANLAAWQAATAQDGNSLSSNPAFVNPTSATPNLHINTSVVSPADATGIAIGTITIDIDGDARSGLTPTDIGADAFIGTTVACVTPTTQPTALTLSSVTATTLSGSFTAATPAVDNYLIIRSTSSTLSATPVNTTVYSVGNTIGGGTVIQVGSSTTFGETGLTPNTQYYYFIFAFNSLCTGGPVYNTTAPLTDNATTCLIAPVSSAASAISTTGFTANWAASAGATGYVLDVSTVSTFASFVGGYNGLAVGNVTSYAVTGLSSSTSYYYRVRATGSSCTSANSTTQNAFTGYCASTASGTTYYITSVSTTGGITNIANTTNAISSGGYGDFTGQSVSQSASSSVSFAVTFSASSTYGCAIFVDWNNDLDFVDAGETVYSSGAYVSSASGSFSVPAGQAVGSYRMRVVANWSAMSPASCNTMTSGETEDYTFNVILPPSCLPPTALTSSAVTPTTATISWTASTSAPASGYEYYVSTSSTPPTSGTTPTGSTAAGVVSAGLTSLSSNTTYYFWVRSNCGVSNVSVWAGSSSFFTGYCPSTASGTTYYINTFATTGGLTNITNNTNAVSSGGYGNFTAQSASQYPALAVNFTSTFSGSVSYGFAIFIDWNNDMDFLDAGETVYNSAAYVYSVSNSFTVPSGQAAGSYRMRVVANYSSNTPVSCNTLVNGETEDYTFTVVAMPNCSGTPTAGTTVASSTSLCVSGSAVLSLSGVTTNVSGLTYQWQSSSNGVTYSNISGATSLTYNTGTISTTTYYQCVVTCTFSSASANSTPVTVTVNNPSIVSTVPASRCGTGTVTLQATSSSGTTMKWYTASTGGTSIGTGASFVTPTISTTTNYYVEAVNITPPVAVGLSSPSAGGAQGNQTTGWDINFTVLANTTLQSVDIYPVTAGQTGTFTVRVGSGFSGTVLATVNYTTTVSGGATPQTITFNTNLTPGSYSLYADVLPTAGIKRNTAGASYPYTSTVANITGNGYDQTYFMGCYNWIFAAQCASARTAVAATVNAAPAIATSGGQTICSGSSSTLVTVTTGASDYDTYTWTPATGVTGNAVSGWTFAPTATTAYTLNVSQSGGSLCSNLTTATFVVKPVPTANAGANATICPGGSTTLAATSTYPSTMYSNDFTSLAGWTSNDLSAWGGYVSNDAGGVSPELGLQWYSGTSGTLNIWSQSPLIDLTNYTSFSAMTMSFKHMIDWYSGTFSVYVETSPDGTTWTQRWTLAVTADVAATTVNVNLTPLIGQSFYVRFRYNAPLTRINYWGIDDMTITGVPIISYAWTPSTGLSATNILTPIASPSTATTYTLTTSVAGCSSAPSNVTVNINTATPANVATATGATLAAGDMLWNGYTSTTWTTASNWYEYSGSAFAVSTNVPTATTRVFVLPSNTTNACISNTNNTIVSAGGDANSVFIGAGATMLINAAQTLNVTGNWTNNGTFTPNATGVVNLTGTNAQTVGGSASNVFTNLTVNKSSNAVTLSAPAAVTGLLTMTAGNINTTATNLLTVGASAAAPGSLNWTAGTVIGPLKRFMSGTASATQASGIFPVGNASYNRYAQVNFNTDPGTGGSIIAEYKAGVCPIGYNGLSATINGLMINNYENEGYWEITPTGGNLNTTAYDLILRGNHLTTVVDLTKLRIIKSSNHTAWNDNPAGDGNHVAATGTVADFTIGAAAMLGFSWFNIGADNVNPLPVTLTSFSANCDKDGVALAWSTASESNSHEFVVEKSRDLESWNKVTTLEGAGNSNYNIDYAATDHYPYGGTSYYRLVQIDNDGIQKVFGPISVSCKDPENSMTVFPNPTKGAFTVEISSKEDISNAEISVLDLTGKLVATHMVTIHEGNNQVMFQDMDLQKGTYIINLATESDFKPVRVMIQ